MRWNRETVTKATIGIAVVSLLASGVVLVRSSIGLPAVSSAAPRQDRAADIGRPIPKARLKVLHVMSFHSPWEWTDSQFSGFKEALRDLDVDYKVYELDAKRRSSPEWLNQAGAEARRLIDEWKPDLVFADDDPAQTYVVTRYLNSSIPFVVCGVNADPQDYGYTAASNVSGVLEREHFVQSVRLLKQIVPAVHRIAIISDNAPMWQRVINRMKASESELGDVQVVGYDSVDTFKEYKELVKGYEGKVDALGFLGIFEFKGADGKNVPYQEVCRWTAENSNLPDFSFWVDRVDYGTLCAVTVSGLSQGQEAGKIARGILVDGRQASSFPMLPTSRGEPVLNLARATKLGLTPNSDVLLTTRVFTKYAWNE